MIALRQNASNLALLSLMAALVTPSLAYACEHYRDTDTRQEVYDLPDAGQGLAVAILPPGASACITETKQDSSGNTWERVEFYTLDDVRYSNAVGWVQTTSEVGKRATESAPAQEATAPTQVSAEADQGAGGKEQFFDASWALQPEQSHLSVMSIKKGNVAEVHRFSDLSGSVAPDGTASVAVGLESVETGVDIRNVRMRFLFFEIDTYPQATISAKLDPAALEAVWHDRRMTMDLPFTLSLRGEEVEFEAPVVISRLGSSAVSVASVEPVLIDTAAFGLTEGLGRLSAAVGDIVITPVVPVNFSLAFSVE